MTFPRADFASAGNAFEREWLVTNALGGFACGTVAQANTRRYHGLLVASLQPPVQRVLMVSKVEVLVRYRNRSYELGSNEFAGGTISPRGFELLSAFEDQDGLPVWTSSCGPCARIATITRMHGAVGPLKWRTSRTAAA